MTYLEEGQGQYPPPPTALTGEAASHFSCHRQNQRSWQPASPARPQLQPAPHYSRHLPLSSQVLVRLDEAVAAAAAAAPSTAARRRPRTRASDSPTAAMAATTPMTQTTSAISPKSPMSSSLARRGIMDCRARPRPRTRFRLVLSRGVGHEKVSARQLPWHVALAWAT